MIARRKVCLTENDDVILFITEGLLPSVEFDVLVEAPAYCLLPKSHRLAGQASVSMAEIATEPLVVLNRPVAAAYYRRLFDKQSQEFLIAAYASSTEMVRSLVSTGHGCAILNMRPRTSVSYCGGAVIELPISDPLPPLTLAVAYDKSRPRRLVQNFVEACCRYFADGAADCCIIEDVFEDKAN